MKFELRHGRPEDAIEFAKLLNKSIKNKTAPFINTNRPLTLKDTKKYAKSIRKREILYFVAEVDNKVIAAVSAKFNKYRLAHNVSLGWAIDENHRGKGIGTKLLKYVCTELKKIKRLKRLECSIVSENKASIKIAKRAGFKRAGILKNAFKVDNGRYHNLYIFEKLL
ncbi:MAG: GNAT family N-acetyltransferase [DPANN group archaeon]|nr:GNAT family N-acetyltransferase [DPANN group archaeon]